MPEEISFQGLFLVAAAAFASPLFLGLFPRLRIPDAVLEILLGVLIGPALLGWVDRRPDLRATSLMFIVAGAQIGRTWTGSPMESLQPRSPPDCSRC